MPGIFPLRRIPGFCFKKIHGGKKLKKFLLAVLAASLFALGAWSESFVSGLEAGVSGTFELAVGEMKKHEIGNVGAVLNVSYPLPLGFSGDSFLSAAGLSLDAGFLLPVGKKDYIDSWWGMDFALGAYVDLKINALITIRPTLVADLRLNMVSSEERNVDGAFMDFGGRVGVTGVFDIFKNGVLLKCGADYAIFPEKDNVCHYIGFNVGMMYRFE